MAHALQDVHLQPLTCLRCQTPLPANADEVAWVCPACGQGQILYPNGKFSPLEIQYSAQITPGKSGRPFWVAGGTAVLQRQTFRGNRAQEMQAFWQNPQRFFVPAYHLPLQQVIELGAQLLLNPPALQAGPAAPFQAVQVPPGDVHPLAEFILLGIEADRKDALKTLNFTLDLERPQLWILP